MTAPATPPVDDEDEDLDDASDLVTDDKNPLVASLKREAIRRRRQVKALRQERADLQAKLQTATTPKDGAVTLEGDDATAWTAYRALNLAPAAIATGFRELGELKAHQRISTAATAVGWRPGVLGTLVRAESLRVEMRTVEQDGKTVALPHVVTGEGEAATAEPLTDYVTAKHAEFLPALQAETPTERPVQKVVTPYPAQRADGGKKQGLSREEEAARRRARGEGPTL